MIAGRKVEIHTERDCKLEAARQQRQGRRQGAAESEVASAAMSDNREVASFQICRQSGIQLVHQRA